MINITQGGHYWEQLDHPDCCPQPDAWHAPAERISALLGPDGEPLMVPFERRKIGFDLTPRGKSSGQA